MRYNAAALDADGAALCNALSGYIISDSDSKFQTKNSENFFGTKKNALYNKRKFEAVQFLIQLQMQDQDLLFLFGHQHGNASHKAQFLAQHFQSIGIESSDF